MRFGGIFIFLHIASLYNLYKQYKGVCCYIVVNTIVIHYQPAVT